MSSAPHFQANPCGCSKKRADSPTWPSASLLVKKSYLRLSARLLLAVPILAACTGGGGSVAVPAPAPSPALTQPATTSGVAVNLQAAKTTVTYEAASSILVAGGMGAPLSQPGQTAAVTITTDASGNLTTLKIPVAGISDTSTTPAMFGWESPRTISLGDIYYLVLLTYGDPDGHGSSISQVAAGQTLSSSAYGLWVSTTKGLNTAGALAFGNLTPSTSVPVSGNATFNGFTAGVGGSSNSDAAYVLQGNAQIKANFSTGLVTTNLTNLSVQPVPVAPISTLPDLSGTSTVSANAYSGPISGGSLIGSINGNFYGPAAQETAGVWQASGSGNNWIGAFGAK